MQIHAIIINKLLQIRFTQLDSSRWILHFLVVGQYNILTREYLWYISYNIYIYKGVLKYKLNSYTSCIDRYIDNIYK